VSEPTYTISADGKSITCRRCGMTSYHPMDVSALFCGQCRMFHQQAIELRELRRDLGNGYVLWLVPQLFGNWLVCIGVVDDDGYIDTWEYHGLGPALLAFAEWDGIGDPIGWYRNPATGRRRPAGDPAKEYIHF